MPACSYTCDFERGLNVSLPLRIYHLCISRVQIFVPKLYGCMPYCWSISHAFLYCGIPQQQNPFKLNSVGNNTGQGLYSCSPRWVSRKLCTVYETVSTGVSRGCKGSARTPWSKAKTVKSANFYLISSFSTRSTLLVWNPAYASGVFYAAVTWALRIGHLLLRVQIVLTPVPSIKLCATASYRLFHSHAQVVSFTDWWCELEFNFKCYHNFCYQVSIQNQCTGHKYHFL